MAALNQIQDILSKFAPALATGLTGGLAPAVISILGQVFNVAPDENVVLEKMSKTDPEVMKASLARAEAAFKADAERSISIQHQIDANVEMMKLDLERGWFFTGWRPLAGWTAILFYAFWATLVLKEGFHGQFNALAHMAEVLMLGGPMMAVAGVVAWQRSEERKAIAQSNSGLQEIVKSFLPSKS